MKRLSVILVLFGFSAAQVISWPAIAQTASPAAAGAASGGACGRPLDLPDKLPAGQAADFQSNPQGLLKRNPVGGQELSGEVRGLTVTDPSAAVDALLEVARSANSMQAAAIGAGLGQAVKMIMGIDKSCGDDITRRIAGSGLSDLLTGYNMAMADGPMLFVGPSDGGGGGFGGVVDETSSSSSAGATTSEGGSTSHTNSADTVSFSGSAITCSTSVSPRRQC